MVWSYLLALESGKQRVAGAAAVFAAHRKLPDINAGHQCSAHTGLSLPHTLR
jgi:hypothetical protein